MDVVSLRSVFGDDAAILRERDFQCLLLATMLPVLGSALVSPVLDSLIGPFGATSANIGLMISVFMAPAIVIIPVAGVLADRYTRRLVLIIALVVFGVTGTLIAFTTDYRVVLALRFFQGFGFAGIAPVIITSIGDMYTGDREATGQGIRFTVTGLSGAVFPLLAGVIVLFGWQYPFLLYALAIPVAATVYVWFEEPVETQDSPTADGGTAVDDIGGEPDRDPEGNDQEPGTGAPAVAGGTRAYVRSLLGLARRWRVFPILVARAIATALWIGFLTYNSLIVVRLMGGSPVQAGVLTSVGFVVLAATASQAGRITAFFDSRLYPLLAANVAVTVGFGAIVLAAGFPVATVGMAVFAAGFAIQMTLYRSLITGFAPPELRAGLVSIAEASGRLTGTLTPIAMAAAIGFGTPALGFGSSLRLAGVGLAVLCGGTGIICLLVANAARPVATGPSDDSGAV